MCTKPLVQIQLWFFEPGVNWQSSFSAQGCPRHGSAGIKIVSWIVLQLEESAGVQIKRIT